MNIVDTGLVWLQRMMVYYLWLCQYVLTVIINFTLTAIRMYGNKKWTLISLTEQVRQLVLKRSLKENLSPRAHFELLQLIDELRLAVETPEETVLRLIYQVRSLLI